MVLALNTLMWARGPFQRVLRYAGYLGIYALDLGALPGCGHLHLRPEVGPREQELPSLPDLNGWRFVAVTADHPGLSSSDPNTRREAVAYTVRAMEAAAALGAGVVGTSLGSVGEGREWTEAAACATEALREILSRSPASVRLSIEIHVNDVCNSLDKASHFLGIIDHPCLGVTFDTSLLYHNRIDIDEAFNQLSGRLFHVHLRGATRDTYFAIPGRDEFDFRRFFRRLVAAEYQGALSLELYEVQERYSITTVEALSEAIPYLRACAEGAIA